MSVCQNLGLVSWLVFSAAVWVRVFTEPGSVLAGSVSKPSGIWGLLKIPPKVPTLIDLWMNGKPV